VPIGDKLLFSEYDYCLNIGGFANISYDDKGVRKAYDICPANIVLNHYTRKIGMEYDDNGNLARTGNVNNQLLEALDILSVYKKNNSLGNEVVVDEFIPLIDSFKLSIPDILKTFITHFSHKITNEFQDTGTVLVTGGGVFNTYLMECITMQTKATIHLPSKQLIDYKEALIFGLLGLLKEENEVNCLSSVTKATMDHSSGFIFYP
jgi:anhydro-N-acetylmuramic acid kinase